MGRWGQHKQRKQPAAATQPHHAHSAHPLEQLVVKKGAPHVLVRLGQAHHLAGGALGRLRGSGAGGEGAAGAAQRGR